MSGLPNVITWVVKVEQGGGIVGQGHEPRERLNRLFLASEMKGWSHEARNADGL